jgi:hypothetical protein
MGEFRDMGIPAQVVKLVGKTTKFKCKCSAKIVS